MFKIIYYILTSVFFLDIFFYVLDLYLNIAIYNIHVHIYFRRECPCPVFVLDCWDQRPGWSEQRLDFHQPLLNATRYAFKILNKKLMNLPEIFLDIFWSQILIFIIWIEWGFFQIHCFFLFFYDTGFNMFLFQFLESKYLPNFFLFPPLDFFCGVLYWCRIHRKVKQENTGPFIFLNLRFSRVLFKIIHNTYRLRPERDSPSLLQSLIYPWGTTVKRNHWILKASRRGKVLLVLNLY